MREKLETIEAGNRQYSIFREEHPKGTVYQVPYRCYTGEGTHTLGVLRTLKPTKPVSIERENGGHETGFLTRADAADAILNHSKKTPYRKPKYPRYRSSGR